MPKPDVTEAVRRAVRETLREETALADDRIPHLADRVVRKLSRYDTYPASFGNFANQIWQFLKKLW